MYVLWLIDWLIGHCLSREQYFGITEEENKFYNI